MGRKKKFEIAPHEKQYNRVDIFRNIQFNQSDPMATQQPVDIGITNPAFATSHLNLSNMDTTSSPTTVYTIPVHHMTTRLKNGQKTLAKEQMKRTRKFSLLLYTSISIVVLLLLAAVILALSLTLIKSKDYVNNSNAFNCPICGTNSICVNYPDRRRPPNCVCKPGFMLNHFNQCVQSMCYTDYMPVASGLSENVTFGMAYNDFINEKPSCCQFSSTWSNPIRCCGVSNSDILAKAKRIIGGMKSNTANWPWIVDVIQVYRSSPSFPISVVSNCTGVLVTDRHVLTAAHCLTFEMLALNAEFPDLKSLLRVHFGFTSKSDIYGTPYLADHQRYVNRISMHEDFNKDLLLNDIAILQLNAPVARSPTVDYLCLYNYALDDLNVYRQQVYAVGWGTINPNINAPIYADTLQYVDLKVLDMSECYYIEPDPNYRFLFNQTKQVCAGYKVSEYIRKDTCFADSGGPLMIRLNGQWFSYGIVSFGSQTSCGLGPAVYTRTAFYYDWIVSKLV